MSADVTGSERTGHVFFVELCAYLPCVLRNFPYLLAVSLLVLLVFAICFARLSSLSRTTSGRTSRRRPRETRTRPL